ncbi:MAG: hypothetical protein JSV25_12955 [Spirochaetota bacterium]|nr:MAG: hypothetical protein JSV25_12955 [Spirochaetota bacterium]
MAITFALYCKECYHKLKKDELDSPTKARSHNSYFICTSCGFETDRGYALLVPSSVEPLKKAQALNI